MAVGTADVTQLARVAKALSDPIRLKMVGFMSEGRECCELPDLCTRNVPGSGTPAEGAKLYVDKGCNQCHGDNGRGGASNMLVGNPSLTADGITSNKTIANFWAYPTTLFDYIRRAMPWPTPHTLTDNEVYAICAYLLAANNLIPQDQAMNAQTLPKVKMPNHDNFIVKFPDRI